MVRWKGQNGGKKVVLEVAAGSERFHFFGCFARRNKILQIIMLCCEKWKTESDSTNVSNLKRRNNNRNLKK